MELRVLQRYRVVTDPNLDDCKEELTGYVLQYRESLADKWVSVPIVYEEESEA